MTTWKDGARWCPDSCSTRGCWHRPRYRKLKPERVVRVWESSCASLDLCRWLWNQTGLHHIMVCLCMTPSSAVSFRCWTRCIRMKVSAARMLRIDRWWKSLGIVRVKKTGTSFAKIPVVSIGRFSTPSPPVVLGDAVDHTQTCPQTWGDYTTQRVWWKVGWFFPWLHNQCFHRLTNPPFMVNRLY